MRLLLPTSMLGLFLALLAFRGEVSSNLPTDTSAESPSARSQLAAHEQVIGTVRSLLLASPDPSIAADPKKSGTPAQSQGQHSADSTPRLDDASPGRIRRVIEGAVEHARSTRALSIPASIIDEVAERGEVRVVFDVTAEVDLARRLAGRDQRARVDDLRVFARIGHAAARLGPEALLSLIESGDTGYIELDSIHRPSLRESLPLIGADLVHRLDIDGDGRVLAILDTGFETDHPMFADRVVEEACFSLLAQCPNAETQMLGPGSAIPCAHISCSHGTHVAGIALGHDPVLELTGVAPHSRLVAIRIFSVIDNEIGAFTSDILAGLQHVLSLAPFYAIDAVNLSFGGNVYPSEPECDTAVRSQRTAIGLLRNLGIATVAASGNERFTNALTTPACLSNVFGVGSTTDEDEVSSFSNSASFLSALAPGQSIESAGLAGTSRSASGTSMASPHVAGAIASIREVYPAASVAEIENALVLSGTPVFDDRNGETHPRIDVHAALGLIAAGSPPPPPPEAEPNPEAEEGSSDISTATPSGSSGGGGSCGLVGIEPFLVLAGLHLGRLGPLARRVRRADGSPAPTR